MIEPLGDRVILTPKEVKRESIIILPNAKDTVFGEVFSTNEGAPVKNGDTVVYDYENYHEVDYKGTKYLIVKYDNLLARVDDN